MRMGVMVGVVLKFTVLEYHCSESIARVHKCSQF